MGKAGYIETTILGAMEDKKLSHDQLKNTVFIEKRAIAELQTEVEQNRKLASELIDRNRKLDARNDEQAKKIADLQVQLAKVPKLVKKLYKIEG